MSQQFSWVDLGSYDLVLGILSFEGKLGYPCVRGDTEQLKRFEASLTRMGFQRQGGEVILLDWGKMPGVEIWKSFFPHMSMRPLSDIAPQVAFDSTVASAMISKGWVDAAVFGDVERGQQPVEGKEALEETEPEPQSTLDHASTDSDRRGADNDAGQNWVWPDLSAYALKAIMSKGVDGYSLQIIGHSQVKSLYQEQWLKAGATITENNDDIQITLPTSKVDLGVIESLFPEMKKIRVKPALVVVNSENLPQSNKLDLGGSLSLDVFKAPIHNRLAADNSSPFTRQDLETAAAESLGLDRSLIRSEFGLPYRVLQEHLEASLVTSLQELPDATVDELISAAKVLDQLMPRENALSANARRLQQYSTPLSVSVALQAALRINKHTTVWEPTAGNGSLVSLAAPGNTFGYEIDPDRVTQLHNQGHVNIQNGDAIDGPLPDATYDRVLTNPPFGSFLNGGPRTFQTSVRREDGEAVPPRISLGSQDKFIALRQLDALSKDGVAGLILGADHPAKYPAGEVGDKTEQFLRFLSDTYHVIDIRYVEGNVYSTHGAGWPLLMIVTGGKRDYLGEQEIPEVLPVISSLDQLNEYAAEVGALVDQHLHDYGYEEPKVERDQSDREFSPNNPQAAEDEPQELEEVIDGGGITQSVDEDQNDLADGSDDPLDGYEDDDQELDSRTRHAISMDEQDVEYQPISRMTSLGKRVPSNLASAITESLNRVVKAHGDIDIWVADEMGWSLDELGNRLAAEQVDSVALALHQAEMGKGFILGDNTGIGKGRVVSALLAWGIKHGFKPVFCTSKAGLFSDIMRDMRDIGEQHLVRPFVMNDIKDMVDNKTGQTVLRNTPTSTVREAVDKGAIPDEFNCVFMTYSQVNRLGSKKAHWLMRVACDNVLMVDEIHNASGPTSNIGFTLGEAIRSAKFTLGSSATYAKRPDNLPLYVFTSMFQGSDPDTLVEAVSSGGTEYQEVLSTMLARSGQLIVRSHQPAPPPVARVINPVYDNGMDSRQFVDALARVLDAMTSVGESGQSIVNAENASIKEIIEAMPDEARGNYNSWRSQSIHFASQMHHVVRVAMYAAKAEAVVEEIETEVKLGNRPLVAVEGTMESFLQAAYHKTLKESLQDKEAEDLAADIKDEDISVSLTYKDTLYAFLERMIVIKRTDRYGNITEDPIFDMNELRQAYENNELTKMIARAAATGDDTAHLRCAQVYFKVEELIDELPDSLPASPIDYVHARLAEKGITSAEMTGRSLKLDYSQGFESPRFRKRQGEEMDRIAVADGFNNGNVQVVLFNAAAAEGVSLHGHKDFANTENRTLLFWQVPGDINVYTQMAGRIDRSGSVEGYVPGYKLIGLDTPTEKRVMANLVRKEGSLKANTKADRDTGIVMHGLPMMNRVGDLVTYEVLSKHPRREMIEHKLSISLDSEAEAFSGTGIKTGAGTDTGLYSKVTGRMSRMQLAESEPLMEEFEEAYVERIETLDQKGINPLKTQIHDLNAVPIDEVEIFPRSGPSAFEDRVVAQRVSYVDAIEPIPFERIKAQMQTTRDAYEARDIGEFPIQDLWPDISAKLDEQIRREAEHSAEHFFLGLPATDRVGEFINHVRANPAVASPDEDTQNRFTEIIEKYDAFRHLRDKLSLGMVISDFPVGSVLFDSDIAESDMYISRIHLPPKGANPAMAGKWAIRLSSPLADIGQFDLSMNQLMNIMKNTNSVRLSNEPLEEHELGAIFNDQREARQISRERYVLQGQLFKGFDMVKNTKELGERGKPGVYSTADGQKLRGIIMPRSFDAESIGRLMRSDFPISQVDVAKEYFRKLQSENRNPVFYSSSAWLMHEWAIAKNKSSHPGTGCVILKDNDSGAWKLVISATKKDNRSYMGDQALLDILQSDFDNVPGQRKSISAIIPHDRIEDVIGHVMTKQSQTFHGFGSDSNWYREFMRERGRRLIAEQEALTQAMSQKGAAFAQDISPVDELVV